MDRFKSLLEASIARYNAIDSKEGLRPEVDYSDQDENRERIAKRKNHIKNLGFRAEAFAMERILGKNNYLDAHYLEQGTLASDAVGKVQLVDERGRKQGSGTGFMVAENILLTNNHVLWEKEIAVNSYLQMNYQERLSEHNILIFQYTLRPDQFFVTDRHLDYTFVAVEPHAQVGDYPLSKFGYLPLNGETGKILHNYPESLTIIQHPEGEYKQIAIRENELLKVLDDFLWYKTDTSPGSSGSPVFNDQWQVVALHHSGVPEMVDGNYITKDGDIWTDDMNPDKLKWKANEGVRVSRILQDLEKKAGEANETKAILKSGKYNAYGQDRILEHPFDQEEPPSEDNGRNRQPSSGFGERPYPGYVDSDDYWPSERDEEPDYDESEYEEPALEHETEVPIPGQKSGDWQQFNLPIFVKIGSPVQANGADETYDDFENEDSHFDHDPEVPFQERYKKLSYRGRKGYNSRFLGGGDCEIDFRTIIKPLQSELTPLKKTSSRSFRREYILDYTNFSVVMHKKRKLALCSAVNIDGDANPYKKRARQYWRYDTRISKRAQTGYRVYAQNRELHRGHVVRKLDPGWGSAYNAKNAIYDTYHYTNCAPQHQNLNIRSWRMLEDYILKNTHVYDLRVSVFTGPVFGEHDPKYRGLLLPLEFYKVVVMVKSNGQLSATAYLLSQGRYLQQMKERDFSFGEYRAWQVKIRDIMQKTGLDFSKLLPYDPKERLEMNGSWGGIDGPEDIMI